MRFGLRTALVMWLAGSLAGGCGAPEEGGRLPFPMGSQGPDGRDQPLAASAPGTTLPAIPSVPQGATSVPPPQAVGSIPKPAPYGLKGSFLVLKKTGRTTYGGLNELRLTWWRDGTEKASLPAVSGQASRQEYRTTANPGPAGSLRPAPEGIYSIGRWDAPSDPSAIGERFYGMSPDPLPRGAFGIHEDANRSRAPGTAGCVGLPDKESTREFFSWMDGEQPPRKLVVDWGLGSLSSAASLALQADFLENFPAYSRRSWQSLFNPISGEIEN